jgi:hypothetical protein
MRTHAHLDWMAVTYPANTPIDGAVPAEVRVAPFDKIGPALYGYSVSMRNDNGALILSDGTAAQGVHVILPSDALLAARAEGLVDRELCRFVIDGGGRASRLDMAVDILDSRLSVAMLRKAYIGGKAETDARTGSEVANLLTPEDTLYIGSRSSYRFFRAYNKGAQVKHETPWLRLELECKRMVAAGMTEAMADSADPRQTINAAIRAYIDFPTLKTYQKALADCDAILPNIPRKMTATYRWLLEQVAPCLARYQFQHPDDQVDQAFVTAWHTAYDRLVLYSEKPGAGS